MDPRDKPEDDSPSVKTLTGFSINRSLR